MKASRLGLKKMRVHECIASDDIFNINKNNMNFNTNLKSIYFQC